MKTFKIIGVLAGIFVSQVLAAQIFNGAGTNWNTGTNWSTGTVPSGTSIDVTVNSSESPTLLTGANNTIGNVTLSSSETFTVQTGATLTLGSSAQFNAADKRSMNFTSSATLNVNTGGSGDGLLEIWGDLIITSSLTMNISGNLIVHGNFQMTSSGTVTVTGGGTITVGGNFTGTSSDQISVSGAGSTIAITGALSLGSSGQISTSSGGTISAASCSCTGCAAQCGVVLPVTLLDFYSSLGSNKVILKWSTSSEINFNYFDLQKSNDGSAFNSIANVKGHGTTNEKHSYEFEDNFPLIGKNYYRLTSVDFDNYQETFRVIVQEYSGEKEFQVSPNPSDGLSITLNFNFDESSGYVTIYDNIGSIAGSFQVSESGKISFPDPLKSGIYLAKYTSSSFTKTIRFLVK